MHNNDANFGNKRGKECQDALNHSTMSKPELTRHVERDHFRMQELTWQEPSTRRTKQQKLSSNLHSKPHGMLNKQSRPTSMIRNQGSMHNLQHESA